MTKFAYNNVKNTSISHISFELNCSYHLCVYLKEDIEACSQSKIANKLLAEL